MLQGSIYTCRHIKGQCTKRLPAYKQKVIGQSICAALVPKLSDMMYICINRCDDKPAAADRTPPRSSLRTHFCRDEAHYLGLLTRGREGRPDPFSPLSGQLKIHSIKKKTYFWKYAPDEKPLGRNECRWIHPVCYFSFLLFLCGELQTQLGSGWITHTVCHLPALFIQLYLNCFRCLIDCSY